MTEKIPDFTEWSLSLMSQNLKVFNSTRRIKSYVASLDDGKIPKTLSTNEFFKKSIFVKDKFQISDIDRLLCMQRAVKNTKKLEKELKISSLNFLQNSDYLFSFFKELAITKTSINDLKNSDIYAQYDEHLDILEDLLNNYKAELNYKNAYDDITVCDDYEINLEFIKSFNSIEIYVDGVLSDFELDIIDKIKNLTSIKLILEDNELVNKKIIKKFIKEIPDDFSGKICELDLSDLKLNLIEKNTSKPDEILHRGFLTKSLECFYIFEKISYFANLGIDPKNIVVILPDESFSELLKNYDFNNMLNFAMGKPLNKTLFVQILKTIIEAILEDEELCLEENYLSQKEFTTKNLFLNKLEIDNEFYKDFKLNFNKNINFEKFEYFVNKILNYSKEEIKDQVFEILFEIKIYIDQNLPTLKDACEIFLLYLNTKSIDHVGGGEVSVMGLLESRGLEFNAVIIPEFNKNLVPKASVNEMFLNSNIRKKAGLISYEDRLNLQKFYYKKLILNAKNVAICYLENDDFKPSVFLKDFENFNLKKDDYFSDEEYLSIYKDLYKDANKPISKRNFVLEHDFFKEPLSFSRLDLFLRCPKCYAIKYIYNIKEEKGVNLELDNKDKGTLIHKVLEETYKANKTFNYDIFKSNLLKYSKDLNINELEKNIILKEFNEFAKKMKDHEKNGWKFLEGEDEKITDFNGIKIKGRIDRIDANDNGDKLVIDYKTGNADSNSLQLPFYKALLGGGDNIKSCFFSTKDMEFINGKKTLSDLQIVIDELKEKFKNPFDFGNNEGCKYCAYDILCGCEK